MGDGIFMSVDSGPGHLKRLIYSFLQLGLQIAVRGPWDFRVSATGHRMRGAKIYVCNHVTSIDPYWLMAALPEYLHFVAGPPFQVRTVRAAFRFMEQINALPEHRKDVASVATKHLANGGAVCVFPEGDLQLPFAPGHFYTGVAKIYRSSRAPIVPIALAVTPEAIRRVPRLDIRIDNRTFEARIAFWGKVRFVVGEPLTPQLNDTVPEDVEDRRITALVREQVEKQLCEIMREFEVTK